RGRGQTRPVLAVGSHTIETLERGPVCPETRAPDRCPRPRPEPEPAAARPVAPLTKRGSSPRRAGPGFRRRWGGPAARPALGRALHADPVPRGGPRHARLVLRARGPRRVPDPPRGDRDALRGARHRRRLAPGDRHAVLPGPSMARRHPGTRCRGGGVRDRGGRRAGLAAVAVPPPAPHLRRRPSLPGQACTARTSSAGRASTPARTHPGQAHSASGTIESRHGEGSHRLMSSDGTRHAGQVKNTLSPLPGPPAKLRRGYLWANLMV